MLGSDQITSQCLAVAAQLAPNKNLLMTLTGGGWDCGVAATASLKATCFHPSASGHDATAHPLLRLSGSSTRPNLATEGSPPQQTPSTRKVPEQTRSLRLLRSLSTFPLSQNAILTIKPTLAGGARRWGCRG